MIVAAALPAAAVVDQTQRVLCLFQRLVQRDCCASAVDQSGVRALAQYWLLGLNMHSASSRYVVCVPPQLCAVYHLTLRANDGLRSRTRW